jgi:guanylate kinase
MRPLRLESAHTPMDGFLLTGPTGVGKSTVQEQLRDRHGFWVPRTCTTRYVEPSERDATQYEPDAFFAAVLAGEVVLPASFGDQWYGWRASDFRVLREEPGQAVLNVRPYTALALQPFLPSFVAVWLTIDEQELSRRKASRRATRDINRLAVAPRQAQDDQDLVYRPCFANVYMADDNVVSRLLALRP